MSLSVISLLVHAYVAWRLIPALAEFTGLQIGVALLVLTSAICLQVGLSRWRSRRRDSSRGGDMAMVAAFVAMGFLSSLLVLTLLRDVALAAVWLGSQLGSDDIYLYVCRLERAGSSRSGIADDAVGIDQCAPHRACGRRRCADRKSAGVAAWLHDRADQRHSCRPDHQGRLSAVDRRRRESARMPTWSP